jgi:hypothetical protein
VSVREKPCNSVAAKKIRRTRMDFILITIPFIIYEYMKLQNF